MFESAGQPGSRRPIVPVRNARDFVFDRVLAARSSCRASNRISTRSATATLTTHYDAFFASNRAVMEDRLNKCRRRAAITGAWEAAGKPSVPVKPTTASASAPA
jgi:hypothetical protein